VLSDECSPNKLITHHLSLFTSAAAAAPRVPSAATVRTNRPAEAEAARLAASRSALGCAGLGRELLEQSMSHDARSREAIIERPGRRPLTRAFVGIAVGLARPRAFVQMNFVIVQQTSPSRNARS